MSLIAVDFDGTLYEENSVMVTIKAGRETFKLGQWLLIFKDVLNGSLRGRGEKIDFRQLFLKSFFRQMKGRSREEIHDFFVSLVKTGQEGLNSRLVSRLEKHLDDGDRLLILSGALQPFLETFVEEMGIKAEVIGTTLYFDENGICTGEISKINNGVEKVNNIKLWMEENNIQNESIWAYADSKSDIPLLEFANKAIVVNPSTELREVAQSRGWEVFS
ncbi:MAG: HAD family hydrolase [Tissierellaceae bacterium]